MAATTVGLMVALVWLALRGLQFLRLAWLERNEGAGKNTNFPTKLSETGLFASVKDHKPAEGVIPFHPNVEQWQDTANSEWLLALPGVSSVSLFDKPRKLPGQVFWHDFRMQFPKDSVFEVPLHLMVLEIKEVEDVWVFENQSRTDLTASLQDRELLPG